MKKKKSLTHATHPIPTRKVFKDKKKYDRKNNKKEIESITEKFKELKTLAYDYKDDKESEAKNLSDNISRLEKEMENIKNEYEFIIIDCPPSLGLITLNCLTSANSVLIPIQCEYFALEGLGKLLSTVRKIQQLHKVPGNQMEEGIQEHQGGIIM